MLRKSICTLLLFATSLSMVSCASDKLEDNLANKQSLEEANRERNNKIRESYTSQVTLAKEYEMNILLTLAGKYDWNALREGESVSESDYVSKGVYSLEKLESSLGVKKSDVEGMQKSSSTLLEGAAGATVTEIQLTDAQTFILSKIDISYYYMWDSGNLQQVVTVESPNGIKRANVVWEEGKVVSYER